MARPATASRTAAATLRSSVRSMSVSLRRRRGHHVLGLRDWTRDARPVDLYHEHLLFDAERKAATVAYLAKPAGV